MDISYALKYSLEIRSLMLDMPKFNSFLFDIFLFLVVENMVLNAGWKFWFRNFSI